MAGSLKPSTISLRGQNYSSPLVIKLVGFIMGPITILGEDLIIQPEVMAPQVQLRVLTSKVAVVVALPHLDLRHQEMSE